MTALETFICQGNNQMMSLLDGRTISSTPTTPPTTRIMLVGVCDTLARFKTYEAAVGKQRIWAHYENGAMPTSWNASSASGDIALGVSTVIHFQPSTSAANYAANVTAIQAFVNTVPSTTTCYLMLWNEPDNNKMTAAVWKPMAEYIVEHVTWPAHVIPGVALMEWTWHATASSYPPEGWMPDTDGKPFCVSVHHYGLNDGWNKTIVANLPKCVATINAHGFKWGIGESSLAGPEDSKPDFWAKGADYCYANGADYFMPFDTTTNGSAPVLTSQPVIDAMKAIVVKYAPSAAPGTGLQTMLGSSGGTNGGSNWAGLWSLVGPIPIHRGFDTGIPATFANAAQNKTDVGRCVSLWSGATSPTTVACGSLDAAISSFLDSIPAGHTTYLTLNHEADIKVDNGQYTAAQFVASFKRFADIVHGKNRPELKTYVCLSDWCYRKKGGTRPEAFWPGAGYCDVWGVDTYDAAFWRDPASSALTFEQHCAVFMDHVTSLGIPWGIPEVGCHENPADPNWKSNWIKDMIAYAVSTGNCAFLSWFNSDVGFPTGQGTGVESSAITTATMKSLMASHNIPTGVTV